MQVGTDVSPCTPRRRTQEGQAGAPIALPAPHWFDCELRSYSAAGDADPLPTHIPEKPNKATVIVDGRCAYRVDTHPLRLERTAQRSPLQRPDRA
jgi:hypothetical protein